LGKLEDARKELASSAISSKILLELYSSGMTRSSVLLETITESLRCSPSMVYDSLDELVRNGLVHSPTDKKRMKFYALTKDGSSLVTEEILKKEVEIRGMKRQVPGPAKDVALDLLAEEIFQGLPEQYKTISARMLVRRNLDDDYDELKTKILEKLKRRT
jgi:DNA-binding PadR family transcriptional regulator